MAVDTQVTTFSDLFTDLQNRVRETTGTTATEDIAQRYINVALHDMHIQDDFQWAIREETLVTHPTYTTGTVTISQGAAALTGASTAWNTANAFGQNNTRARGKLKLGGVSDVYEVSSVGSDTAITLDSRFTGANLSAASYTYFEDEYDLASDFFRLVDKRQFSDAFPIYCMGDREFYRRFVRNDITGSPKIATIIEDPASGNTTRVQRVVFHPAPDVAYMINYRYITSNLAISSTGTAQTQMTASTDEPIIPLRYRHVLVYHALYNWYRDRGDDARSQEAKSDYVDLVRRISQDTGPTSNTARIVIRRKSVTPRLHSRRYAIGTWFDELRDRR